MAGCRGKVDSTPNSRGTWAEPIDPRSGVHTNLDKGGGRGSILTLVSIGSLEEGNDRALMDD